jgi:hypothetical protein
MYAASQEGAANGAEASPESGTDGGEDDNVSDVEFEEVEDKDK